MKTYNAYINEIERLFEDNRPLEAESLIISARDEARQEDNNLLELQMQNELIGYYRQTSEKDKLKDVLKAAMKLADEMRLLETQEGKVAYATTALNEATGYRSIGELEISEHYYETVKNIYDEILDSNDMLRAGLYNNMSLLYQEKKDYISAMSFQNG